MTAKRFPVLFTGAGPGDPDLITVKGQKALMQADLVIYAGSLVPEALLKWANPNATNLNSASLHLQEIVSEMEKGYLEGKRVVRLHTGDPSLYGAILEQMAGLEHVNIPYEVIPGVTAAFAAAAAMKIEYTLPEITQTLILTRMAGRTPVPESENLASLARHKASLAIYLSITMVDAVAEILASAYGKDALCAIAHRVSQPDEKIIVTRISELSQRVKEEGITHQALIIAGKVFEVSRQNLQAKSKLYDENFSHGFRK